MARISILSVKAVLLPKYSPQIPYLAIFGCVIERAKYGQMGCPWKDLAKCSSDAVCRPVKSYDQISFLADFPIVIIM